MTEAITSVTLVPTKEGNVSGAVNAPGSASNYDMRDFSAAMSKNSGASSTADPTAAATESVGVPNGDGMKSLFSAFDHLNGSANKVEDLAKMVGAGNEMSPSQVVRLTMASHEFMFQSQLTSNVANRTSDGVQQLFRQQS